MVDFPFVKAAGTARSMSISSVGFTGSVSRATTSPSTSRSKTRDWFDAPRYVTTTAAAPEGGSFS